MKRKVRNLAILVSALLAVAAAGFFASVPADECGPCGGPLQSVSGHGDGFSCSEALNEAHADAIAKAYQGGASCEPCQITTGSSACYAIDYYPTRPPGAPTYGATQTLHHRCVSCSPGPPPIQ